MPKSEHEVAIKEHVSSPRIVAAVSSFGEKATAGPVATSYWVTFLLTVMLPMLPSLLKQAAPKIMANPKLLTALRLTRDAISGILEE